MHFKSIWIVLLGICLPYQAAGTETCRGCRSMELQLSPGIGVELGLDSLTSATTLANGTTIDLVHMPGSDRYKALMHDSIAEARGVQDGLTTKRSWMPWLNELDHKASWRSEHRILTYLCDHYPSLRRYFGEPLTPVFDADNGIRTLVQDLTHLKVLSEEKLGSHINETSISFPSITELLGQSFAGYVRQSFRSAGFLVPMDSDGIAVQHAALSTTEITGPTLGVEYSNSMLSLTIQLPHVEQPEYPHLERVGIWVQVGARFENTSDHWARVNSQLKAFLATSDSSHKPITQVLITGDISASSPTLHQVIADTLPEINSSTYIRESPKDYIFAAARGASSRARLSMLHGGDLCVPDSSCEMADGHPWKQGGEL